MRAIRGTMIALAVAAAGLAAAPAALATTIAAKPDSTWQTNGRVLAVAATSTTVYLGGTFTEVEDHTGVTAVRNHMAAFDIATGALVPTFDPAPSGAVRAILIGPTGTIYVGGDFTTIAGKAKKRLAALDATGAALAFKATMNASVFGLTMLGSTVYAGGTFTTVNGTARTRLAAVDATSGALASGWTPAADAEVTSLATNGSTIFAGGLFTHIGTSSQSHVAALSPSTGAVQAWAYHPAYPVEGMAASSSTLYLAGGGAGGRVGALATAGGAKLWEITVDGNVQQVGLIGSEVVAGGHFDRVCDPGTNCANPITRHKVLAASAATGALDTTWHPSINSTLGVFAVATSSSKVWLGGDFTKAGGLAQAHFAQFSATP